MPKRYRNVYGAVASFSNVRHAERKAGKGKGQRDEVLVFRSRKDDNLQKISAELVSKTYKPGPYSVFRVSHPVRRMIMALRYRDRVVQWAIYLQVFPLFDQGFIYDSYACRKGKGAHAALDRVQYWMRQCVRRGGTWYTLKMDISKFFYRIDHAILMQILAQRIDDPDMMRLFAQIINSDTMRFGLPVGCGPDDVPPDCRLEDVGIPIGNLTSQMFANIYLDVLDQFVKHCLHVHFYARYMDDLLIISNSKEELLQIWAAIEGFLAVRLHLQLNHKTSIQPFGQGVEFVGVKLWPTHRRLRKLTIKGIKHRLAEVWQQYLDGIITEERLKRTINSYKGILSHVECMALRHKLNQMCGRLAMQKLAERRK